MLPYKSYYNYFPSVKYYVIPGICFYISFNKSYKKVSESNFYILVDTNKLVWISKNKDENRINRIKARKLLKDRNFRNKFKDLMNEN